MCCILGESIQRTMRRGWWKSRHLAYETTTPQTKENEHLSNELSVEVVGATGSGPTLITPYKSPHQFAQPSHACKDFASPDPTHQSSQNHRKYDPNARLCGAKLQTRSLVGVNNLKPFSLIRKGDSFCFGRRIAIPVGT